jgi:hypothetical protein
VGPQLFFGFCTIYIGFSGSYGLELDYYGPPGAMYSISDEIRSALDNIYEFKIKIIIIIITQTKYNNKKII